MSIGAVILDYGEVICRRPAAEQVARMARAVGLDPETYQGRYDELRGPYDRGELEPAEYWSAVAGRELDGERLGKLRRWDVEQWTNIDHEMTDWIDRLRAAGFKSAILSNMHVDMAAHARQAFEWLQRVDCAILSCEVHLIKPERAIYERCIECLAVPPSATLFVDDREVNILGARDVGLIGLRFESVARLRGELTAMGFPVLPGVERGGGAGVGLGSC
jgi:putative hydrolase of the HAD superfamily